MQLRLRANCLYAVVKATQEKKSGHGIFFLFELHMYLKECVPQDSKQQCHGPEFLIFLSFKYAHHPPSLFLNLFHCEPILMIRNGKADTDESLKSLGELFERSVTCLFVNVVIRRLCALVGLAFCSCLLTGRLVKLSFVPHSLLVGEWGHSGEGTMDEVLPFERPEELTASAV